MKYRALLLVAVLLIVAMPLFAGTVGRVEPMTTLKCNDGKGGVYSLGFAVERSGLGAIPEGCEVESEEKRYEPPSFVRLQAVVNKDGLMRVGVGSRSTELDAELISEWHKKADSLCPVTFKVEEAPVMSDSRSSELCGRNDLCKGFRVAVGEIRCEGQ